MPKKSAIKFHPERPESYSSLVLVPDTETHFCRTCGKRTIHVITPNVWLDGRDADWPYYQCQFCGTKVPENPFYFCCRACDPKVAIFMDQGYCARDALLLSVHKPKKT